MSIAADNGNAVTISSEVGDTMDDMEGKKLNIWSTLDFFELKLKINLDDDAPLTDVVNTQEKTDDKENFESAEMWIEANGTVKACFQKIETLERHHKNDVII